MGGLDISGCEDFSTVHADECQKKAQQVQKPLRNIRTTVALHTPSKTHWNGSTDALWFSTKFEKKMAALDDGPASPLAAFQRSLPCRKSRINSGPFRATQIWNRVIEHLQEKVELKKRRYKLRNYSDCFTGTDAVDVVLHFLLNEHENFCSLSREKAIKLCQTLMNKHVFHPVGSKTDDVTLHHFEDSSSKLYHFIGDYCVKDTKESGQSDWEDESGDREECEIEEEELEDTPPEQVRSVSDFSDSSFLSRDAESCRSSTSDVFRVKSAIKRKFDSPFRQSKHHKLCSSSESLSGIGETITLDRIEEVRKEVALCQLLTLVDISFLEGLLTDEKDKKRLKPHHMSGPSSSIVSRHWSMTCAASSVSHSDPYMKVALDCIAHIPRGVSKFDTDFTKSSDAVTKLQAYNMICEYYCQRAEPLFLDRFHDLNMAILQHVLAGRDDLVLQALQLSVILLPSPLKEELKRLFKFLLAAVEDNELRLDTRTDNKTMMLNHFTNCVFKHKDVPFKARAVFIAFFTHHVEQIFSEPKGFSDKVDSRVREIQDGQVPVVEETAFCNQMSSTEYKRQSESCTETSLIQMMNFVIDDPKLPLKDKKHRLRQFRKCYPQLYDNHFSGML